MGVNYIPNRDADFATWAQNFYDTLAADPSGYGWTAPDISALNTLNTAFQTAYAAATAGATRGPSTITTKDAARVNLQTRCRQMAQAMQVNPAITDTQKNDLQITIRKTNLTPVPAPTTSPLLAFVAATPLQHTIRFADQLTPDSRAKPFGAASLRLRVWVHAPGAAPTGQPNQTLQLSRNPAAINFDNADQNKVATYIGNWITSTGLIGPDSTPLAQGII